MKQLLLNIADRIDERVMDFEAFPRTQATDAMKGIGGDIAKIIREEAMVPEEDAGAYLTEVVEAAVSKALADLTAPAKAPKKKS